MSPSEIPKNSFRKDMKRKKENHKNYGNYSDGFSLMENAIDLSMQKEYLKLSATIDFDHADYRDVLTGSQELFSEDTSIELKKKILILLAHSGTAATYQIIEKYWPHATGELKDWALLSLKECRTFLESDLLEIEGQFVSTGLGGKDSKVRYYFVVGSKGGPAFTETRRDTLKKGFEAISQRYNSEIEEIHFEADYIMIRILIPMDVAVGDVIEKGISECNTPNELLNVHYYVTNVQKPTDEKIRQYLEEFRRAEKPT